MDGRDITALGYREGPIVGLALKIAKRQRKRATEAELLKTIAAVKDAPAQWASDPVWGPLAQALTEERDRPFWVERDAAAPYQIWGEGLEDGALMQMRNAVRLPVAVSGALMPDAHQGYGLPIGGVLATQNAVIPYAVGVDIACRTKLSVFDVPASDLPRLNEQLVRILQRETVFGTGGELKRRAQHDVMDEDWSVTKITARLKDAKAHAQLGTSGSGNHFVEFGTLTIDKPDLGLEPGAYLAVLSHSGSRGSGAQVAQHYSRLAMDLHPELPPDLRYLAWLDMDSEPGQEYWAAMNLMGQYAAANHAVIHQKVAKALGAGVLTGVENHHNFCIPATERIPTPDGPMSIRDLKPGDRVYSFDPERGLVPTKVKAAWSSGRKVIYTIRTGHRKIRLSGDHPVLTVRGGERTWVNADAVRPGDRVVCAQSYYRADRPLPPGHARFIGAFLGDGWVRADTKRRGYSVGLAIGSDGDAHTARYVQLIQNLELPDAEKGTWKAAALKLKVSAPGAYGISGSNKRLYRFVEGLGLALSSTIRRVPARMFAASVEDKLQMLAGYMDADGSIGHSQGRDGSGLVRACNEPLVRDVREIAIAAGLRCTNVRRAAMVTSYGETVCYGFNISPASMKRLDLWHDRKRVAVERAAVRPHGRDDSFPEGLFAEKVLGVSLSEAEEDVFDLEVEHSSHSFVCEGVVVHNCWLEEHDGKQVYVHRKGATPAGAGVLGVIPGSMAAPGFVVRGKGNAVSLESASHGAGRLMSRTAAREKFRWNHVKPVLEERGVQLLSAGIDENPFVYKDIHAVMAAQADLVEVVARFDPRIVKMADAGEKPED